MYVAAGKLLGAGPAWCSRRLNFQKATCAVGNDENFRTSRVCQYEDCGQSETGLFVIQEYSCRFICSACIIAGHLYPAIMLSQPAQFNIARFNGR